MSKNSHAHLRYNILDYCFREKALIFKDLLDYVNNCLSYFDDRESISVRAQREDIKVFKDKEKDFGTPLPDNKRVYQYTAKKQVINIQYKGFKDNKIHKYVFHPYILKQYNRRWFVFGNNYSNKIKEWSTPIDGTPLAIRMLGNVSYIKLQADWSNLFRTQVGVIRPKDARIERVVLRFYNSRETYFKTTLFQPDYVEFLKKINKIKFGLIL